MSETKIERAFEKLLHKMMMRRLYISLVVLITFLGLIFGIGAAITFGAEIDEQWKEFLLLLLGAFIGSYGKIIDYWFRDTDKDKMLVQKMDEEDGVSLSDTDDMESTPLPESSILPESFSNAIDQPISSENDMVENEIVEKKGVEIDEDNDGIMDGLDYDDDGIIDEYFEHRNCTHVWGDKNEDGIEECLICGLIKEN
jgi:hypothetical protein